MKKIIRSTLLIAVMYAFIVACLAGPISDRYLANGAILTGIYYGSLSGLAALVLMLLEHWLKGHAQAATGAETDDERADRVLHIANVAGSDKLDTEDYAFLMSWVANKGKDAKEATRAYQDAIRSYARHSSEVGPVIYAPGEPLVKRNEPTPVSVAEDLEHRLAS